MGKYLFEMPFSASVGRGALAPPLTLRNGIYPVISSVVERSRGSERRAAAGKSVMPALTFDRMWYGRSPSARNQAKRYIAPVIARREATWQSPGREYERIGEVQSHILACAGSAPSGSEYDLSGTVLFQPRNVKFSLPINFQNIVGRTVDYLA